MSILQKISKALLPLFAVTLLLGAQVAPMTTHAAEDCEFDRNSTELCNPLPDSSVEDLVYRILKFILGITAGAAVVVIVISGFRMVVNSGSDEQVKKAKQAITWAIMGLIVSALAYSMVAIVQNVLKGNS